MSSDVTKTVFISYRRSIDKHLARLVFNDLRQHGYDVYLDVHPGDSSNPDGVNMRQVAARAHFIVLLSPGALEHRQGKDDCFWDEIRQAIRLKRHIVPILEEGFNYAQEIQSLSDVWRQQFIRYDTLPLSHFYFDSGMEALRTRFLRAPGEVALTPAPEADAEQVAYRIALAIQETGEAQERFLEVAVPACTLLNSTTQTQVRVKLSMQGSSRLKDDLKEVVAADDVIHKVDVRSGMFPFHFTRDARSGKLLPDIVHVKVKSAEFDVHVEGGANLGPGEARVQLDLFPDYSSRTLVFNLSQQGAHLNPMRSSIAIHLYQHEQLIAELSLATQIVENLEAHSQCHAWQLKVIRYQVITRDKVLQVLADVGLDVAPESLADMPETPNLTEIGLALARPDIDDSLRERVLSAMRPPVFALVPLPPPFEWIDIPGGEVRLERGGYVREYDNVFMVGRFAIAKYPVTNAQFAKFVDARGYETRRWWTEAGWRIREAGGWTEPRFWRDSQWNQDDCPVVGVSWYEAVAFCLWLRDVTGQDIMLPTEQQWQRAAQGDSGRAYPWGDEFDANRCNFAHSGPTPVTQYENGASVYDVMDMSGNTWEWCRTAYDTGSQDLDEDGFRVLRGGSFFGFSFTAFFRTDFRGRDLPDDCLTDGGFRLALTY